MNWAEWNKEMEVACCLSLNKWIDQYSNRIYLNKVEGLTLRSVTWNRLPIKILLMDWNSSVVWKIVFCISQSTLLDRFFLDTTALVVNFPLLRHRIHIFVQLLVHWCLIQTTVIVAQSQTSNHSVFKEKCFIIENNGKTLSEKQSRTNNGDFSLPWSPHQGYDDQKRVPTLIKPAQQVKAIIFSQVKVLCEKRSFSVSQTKIKPLSHTGGNKIYNQSWLPWSPHS